MKEVKINKPITCLKVTINSLLEKAKRTNKFELQGWLEDENNLKAAHKKLKNEQLVSTFIDPDDKNKVQNFFYPITVQCTKNKIIQLIELIKVNGNNGILIQGRLGQGKSILLRYLQFLELNMGESIPIFLELRKIKRPSELISSAREKLNSLGFSCSEKLFQFLLDNGGVSLFFDGFDETPLEERNDYNDMLTNICCMYPNTKVLVTSRHNTEIKTNPNFKNYSISLLNQENQEGFIKKILAKENLYKPILEKMAASKEFDYTVLDTPLLLTWFILVYQRRYKIPKTKLGFYEDLFSAILSRHDGMKESLDRSTRSKLSDDEIKEVFITLCYLSRKSQIRVFSKDDIISLIRKALNICKFLTVKPADYLYDLTHIACLIVEDGLDYEFIHESVVQYFSARFLKKSTEENAKKFYENRIKDWKTFEGELSFLIDIDQIRFAKYFYVPSILDFLKKNVDRETVSNNLLDKIFAGSVVATELKSTDKQYSIISIITEPNENYAITRILSLNEYGYIHELLTYILKELDKPHKNLQKSFSKLLISDEAISLSKFTYFDFLSCLVSGDLKDHVYDLIRDNVIDKIYKDLNKFEQVIKHDDSLQDLYA